MKNPWLIIAGCIMIFAVAFFLDRSPEPLRALIKRIHTDKLLHFAAGYLLAAIGLVFLGIRDTGVLLLFAISVGAGWEVFQHVSANFGVALHEESAVFGRLEPYADLAADIAGALLYWVLHLAGKS